MRNFYQKAIVITMVLGNYSASDAMLSSFVKSFSTKTSLFSLSGAAFLTLHGNPAAITPEGILSVTKLLFLHMRLL